MIEALSYALFCGFGLSAFLVPLTALAMRRATELGGATRHAIWFIVLIGTVAATGAAFAVSVMRPAAQSALAVVSAAAPADTHAAALPRSLCATFLACWLVISIAGSILLARRIGALRAMKERGTRVEVDCALPRGARALASDVSVPAALGFLHPAILLPSRTLAGRDTSDARLIVLHEAAHLRRGDDLTGLGYRVCAALFWFNPFLHYIGKQLSRECEIACDDIVVRQTGDATRYAALLFEVAKSNAGEGPLAWSAFAHASGLVARIRNVLLPRSTRRAHAWPALVLLGGALLITVGLVASNAPALSRTGDDPSVRVRPVSGEPLRHQPHETEARQRVRDFAACTAHDGHDGAGALYYASPCEDVRVRVSRSTIRIRSGAISP